MKKISKKAQAFGGGVTGYATVIVALVIIGFMIMGFGVAGQTIVNNTLAANATGAVVVPTNASNIAAAMLTGITSFSSFQSVFWIIAAVGLMIVIMLGAFGAFIFTRSK